MRTKLAVPVLASILIMGTLGISNFPITDASHFVDATVVIEITISDIEALVASGDLTEKDGRGLIKSLENVIKELGKDKIDKALKEMDKFNKDTQKLIDKGLDETVGLSLIVVVTAIQDSFAEPPVQTIKITVIKEGERIEGADCRLSFGSGLIVDGLTDVNGEVLLFVPAELESIIQTKCNEPILVPPGPSGTECNVSLNGVFTEIEIQIGPSPGCF